MAFDSDTPEPTTGFRIGTAEHYRWLKGIVKWLLVLNLIDAVLTIFWVHAGLATEANTLMDELVTDNALVFVSVKLGLVGMGSWVLWRLRESPSAVVAIFVAFVVYYAILVHHVQYLSGLVGYLLGG
jgi:hypothetical protein